MNTASSIKSLGIRPNKALGQNFLADEEAKRQIALLSVRSGLPIIEIGAGLGAITLPIAEFGARITAVEIDAALFPHLAAALERYPNADALNADFMKCYLDELHNKLGGGDIAVIGNLPYYITSPICKKLILSELPIKNMVLMVQKEAAERFVAQPGDRNYGPLSVMYGYMYEVSTAMQLPKEAYYPMPEVSSVVLTMESRRRTLPEGFYGVLKAAFAMRRKTLANNLIALGLSKPSAESVLTAIGMAPDVRAETLDIEQFVALTNEIRHRSR